MDRIEEIRARVEKASEGPWTYEYQDKERWLTLKLPAGFTSSDLEDEDIVFTAHAREDIPYLLIALESLSARFADIDAHNVTLMEHVKGQDVLEQQDKSALAEKDKRIEELTVERDLFKRRSGEYYKKLERTVCFDECQAEPKITLLEAVVDASKGLFGGDGRLATSETCRNCVNTMARMLKVGDALAALGKESSDGM